MIFLNKNYKRTQINICYIISCSSNIIIVIMIMILIVIVSTTMNSDPGVVNSFLVKMNGVVRIMFIKLLFSTENLETKNR